MNPLYDYTESDEIAENMKPPRAYNFDAMAAWVRSQMPDESMQVIDNTAEALCRRHRTAWFAPKAES